MMMIGYTYMLCEWQWHVVRPLQGLAQVGFSPLELHVLLLTIAILVGFIIAENDHHHTFICGFYLLLLDEK